MINFLPSGTVVADRYQIEILLGSGGFGAVYQVRDLHLLGQVRALKVAYLQADDTPLRREMELLTRLEHPGLPRVYDGFVDAVGHCIVMDFIHGDDLGAECLRRRCTIEEAYEWLVELGDILAYLHEQRPAIFHRDVKPQNIKRNQDGRLILLDFGLAKGSLEGMTVPLLTRAGYTPHYAPLEQIRGAPTDARGDVYALAATVYTLLSGQIPPDAVERAAAQIGSQLDPLVPIERIRPDIPASLARALARAMALDPALRYPTVRGFVSSALDPEEEAAPVGDDEAGAADWYPIGSLLRRAAALGIVVGMLPVIAEALLPVPAAEIGPLAAVGPALQQLVLLGIVIAGVSWSILVVSYFLRRFVPDWFD